jgi:hypothetical protein
MWFWIWIRVCLQYRLKVGPLNHCTMHTSRSYYIDLLLIKMPVLAMFQEIWSQFKVPSTNRQQFSKHGTGHFSNQFSKN